MMNPNLILSGRGISPVAAFNDADIASQNALATNQAYAMRDYYRQNGAGVLAGDQNALAGLAQIGPLGAEQAFSARANVQTQQTNSFNLEQAKIEAARQTEAHLAQMDEATRQQEAETLRNLAGAAAAANSPERWDNVFRGTPYEGSWDQRGAVLAILGTQKEVLDRVVPPAPDPADRYKVVGGSLFDLQAPDGPAAVGQGAMQEEIIYGADGKPLIVRGGPGTGAKLTEAEGRNTGFLFRLQTSDSILSGLEDQGTSLWNKTANSVPVLGNYMVGPEAQKYEQAKRDFVNAILRRESGAVISPSEFANAEQQYFPQPGDSPEVIAQKAQNRKVAIEGVRASSGAGGNAAIAPAADSGSPTAPADMTFEEAFRLFGSPNQ